MENYKTQFHIRYVILTFTIRMSDSCVLPPEKCSMFRGGFGNCLLDGNCICAVKPPDCAKCSFEQACIVRNIMYASLKCRVPSLHGVQSEGYIFDCMDKRTRFLQGDMFSFSMTLFGDIIVYLQPVLQALFRLGQEGIGKERAGFEIVKIKNSFGDDLFKNGSIYLKNYQFQYLDEYILDRKKEFSKEKSNGVKIKLESPLSLQYQGTMLKVFHAGAFLNGLARRAYIMSCFEGQDGAVWRKWKDGTAWGDFNSVRRQENMPQMSGWIEKEQKKQVQTEKGEEEYIPKIEVKNCVYKEIKRYSSTQKKKMPLCGIEGEFMLKEPTEEMMWYLFAGEILHVGKYSSFGFGKYVVKPA
jgi:hypothetical protein